jgi:hypothetical protein
MLVTHAHRLCLPAHERDELVALLEPCFGDAAPIGLGSQFVLMPSPHVAQPVVSGLWGVQIEPESLRSHQQQFRVLRL